MLSPILSCQIFHIFASVGKIIVMDITVFNFLNNLYGSSGALHLFWKILAEYLIYPLPLFLVLYWFFVSKKIALRAFLAGVFAWFGFAYLIGNLYFRARPEAVIKGRELLFHRPTYSFPSDHAAFLFAVAMSFYLASNKKAGIWLFVISAIISISRIIVGFHWPSDILAGWILGIIAAYLIFLIKDPLERHIINPLIWLVRKVHL